MVNTFRWGILLLFFGALTTFTAFAEEYAATVIVMKGKATRTDDSMKKEVPIKVQDRLKEGTVIHTSGRSFVKLLFADNSQLNLGPNSKLKIERHDKKKPGMLKLISGQIRAKVTKDVLSEEKRKRVNKLYIRTKTAAMGVRGTEFQVSFDEGSGNTAIVSFEDVVAFAQFETSESENYFTQPPEVMEAVMEQKLSGDDVVLVSEGRYSAANPNSDGPLPAVRISPVQFEAMKANETLLQLGTAQGNREEPQFVSPIPPGVDPKEFASDAASIERVMESAMGENVMEAIMEARDAIEDVQEGPRADGPVDGSEERSNDGVDGTADATVEPQEGAPLAGGYVDMERGIYIEPKIEAGAVFDPEQNIYIPDPSMQIGDGGEIVVPEGVEISESGEMVNADGTVVDPRSLNDPSRVPTSRDGAPDDGRGPDGLLPPGSDRGETGGDGGDDPFDTADDLEAEEEAEFEEVLEEEEDEEAANSSSDSNITVIIDI